MPYAAKKAFCCKIARVNALLLLLEKNVSEFSSLIRFADLFCCCYFMVREPQAKLQGIFHNFYALP